MATHSVDTGGTTVGAKLAGHTVTEELDRDARHASFKADAPDGTAVILQVSRRDGEEAAARFLEQAERLAGVDHPGLPKITGYGDVPEGLWVASVDPARRHASAGKLLVEAIRAVGPGARV